MECENVGIVGRAEGREDPRVAFRSSKLGRPDGSREASATSASSSSGMYEYRVANLESGAPSL